VAVAVSKAPPTPGWGGALAGSFGRGVPPRLSNPDPVTTKSVHCATLFKVSWYPKIDHVFEKYTSVIFR